VPKAGDAFLVASFVHSQVRHHRLRTLLEDACGNLNTPSPLFANVLLLHSGVQIHACTSMPLSLALCSCAMLQPTSCSSQVASVDVCWDICGGS